MEKSQTTRRNIELAGKWLSQRQFGFSGSVPESSACLTAAPAQQEAAIAESKEIDPSYHGHIRDDAKACWISFPGKYAAGRSLGSQGAGRRVLGFRGMLRFQTVSEI